MVRSMRLPLLLLLLFCPAALAQESDAIREHMKVVRDRRTTLPGKIPAMEALLGLGVEGARQLARALGEDLAEATTEYTRKSEKFMTRFEAAAIRTGESRGGQKDAAEIDQLRKTIMRNAQNLSLTKEQVVAESDPALARLTEFYHISLEQVYAQEDRLIDEFFELLSRLESNQRMFEYFDRARTIVASSEDAKRILKQLETVPDPGVEEARLVALQQRIVIRAIPMSDNSRRILSENDTLAKDIDSEEAAGILELNLIRIRCGLNALRIDTKLCDAGRGHSQDMKELDFFDHVSPVEGKKTFGERASKAGTSAQSENIARGQRTGRAAIDGWWHSPGHHRNMMAPATRIGIGRFEFHWTQLFG